MIEYLILAAIILLVVAFLCVFAYIQLRKQEIQSEIEYNKYRLAKKKLYINSKTKQEDNEDDEVTDFIESLPKWLSSIAEGANIDLEKVYDGDPDELKKVKDILDKNLPGSSQNTNGGLVG